MNMDEDMTAVGNRENREKERDRGGRNLDADLANGGGGDNDKLCITNESVGESRKDAIIQTGLEKMNLPDVNGRELVVKEDQDEQCDQHGGTMREGGGSGNANGGDGGNGGGGISAPRSNIGGNRGNENALVGIDYSTGAYNVNRSHTILVKNLPLNWTLQEFWNHFRQIGEIEVAFIRDNDIGVVRFNQQSDAELATILNGSRLNGRSIEVSLI